MDGLRDMIGGCSQKLVTSDALELYPFEDTTGVEAERRIDPAESITGEK